MQPDKELSAIQAALNALEVLEGDTRQRAYDYVGERLGLNAAQTRVPTASSELADRPATSNSWGEFAELFAAAQPATDKERALVGGYWRQVCRGDEQFASQTINADLKNLGHGVGNIAEALGQLIDERPQLVLQLRKAGATKQARKTYKMTIAGRGRVEAMIRSAAEQE